MRWKINVQRRLYKEISGIGKENCKNLKKEHIYKTKRKHKLTANASQPFITLNFIIALYQIVQIAIKVVIRQADIRSEGNDDKKVDVLTV